MDKLSGTFLKLIVTGCVLCCCEFEATVEPPPPQEIIKNNENVNKYFIYK